MTNLLTEKKHVLADRLPMVSAILWILIGMYLPNTGVATLLDPFYDAHPDVSRLVMFIGVIFTLSGNIWPCIFLHSLYDTLAFSSTSADAKPDMAVYFEVAVYCIFMILYLILLYGKREKASALWNRKWNADSLSHSPAADGCEP